MIQKQINANIDIEVEVEVHAANLYETWRNQFPDNPHWNCLTSEDANKWLEVARRVDIEVEEA